MAKKQQKAGDKRTPNLRCRIRLALILALAASIAAAAIVFGGLLPFGRESRTRQVITDHTAPLAPFYAAEVMYWREEIEQWARDYRVNPNVLAIVIQIESCGDPTAISSAGALGLMQVMPFHFGNGVNMINPDTNVSQGMTVFYECLTVFAGWDLGMALACYNGGPSVTQRPMSAWARETQFYYRWATGLWDEVVRGARTSRTLDDWLGAGGANLCRSAAHEQSARSSAPVVQSNAP